MSKHTPGPWRVETRVAGKYFAQHQVFVGSGLESERPYALARVYSGMGQLANAHLIAAAPELLEACKAAIGTFAPDTEHVAIATLLAKAIAKAETE